MKNIALVLFCLLTYQISAQHVCGFDQLREIYCEEHDHSEEIESAINSRIYNRTIDFINSGTRGGDEVLIIPVVVHIIHQNGDENISDEAVLTGIEHLNNAYSNSGSFFDSNGFDTNIQFCLAKVDPEGNFSDGINRVVSPLTNVDVPSEEQQLKDLIRWNTELYLNIWLVKEVVREDGNEGVLGFSSFLDSHGLENDGVVCEAQFFGLSEEGSGVHIHEIGHYLGLYHTFQDGCPNGDCLTQGDLVCDTPPDQHVFNTFCFDGTNSCDTDEDDTSTNNPFRPTDIGGLGDQLDMQDNFMDYSSLLCFSRFTEGQSERMIASILEVRFSLLEGNRCDPPCDSPIIVDVELDSDDILFGETVTFTNNSTNFDNSEWFVNDEFIDNSADFEFSFEEQGINTVELVLSNGTIGCEQVVVFEIQVSCPIDVSFIADGTSFPLNESILFENESEGASSFQWFIDGELVSSSEDLNYTFVDPGGYSIYLIASNGECEVQSAILFVSIGICVSGNENNIWNFFNPAGNFYGFDFNEDNVSQININNLDEEGHCKATISDSNGNLLFIATGERVLDKDYEVMSNGSDMLGNTSSHFGAIFMKAPMNEDLYYLFTQDAQENGFSNGLRYSIIDLSLNGGFGDVTDVKNILIEETSTESVSTIRHCNMTDFWVVFYDENEAVYKSYLVDETGVSEEPVISEFSQEGSIVYRMDLRVSPGGNMIIHANNFFDFNQSTGEFSLITQFDFDLVVAHDFSPNSRVLYMETGLIDVKFRQLNLDLSIEDMLATQYIIDLDDLADVGFDIKLGPDGRIYKEEIISGNISVIENPNLIGESMGYDDNAFSVATILNSFGNFHHGYISGQVIEILGPDSTCVDEPITFELVASDCVIENITWEIVGYLTVEGGSEISVDISVPGEYTVRAEIITECGVVEGVKTFIVSDYPIPELGEDMAICVGFSLTLSPGEFESYDWNGLDTNSSLTINEPGNYSVTVTENGCSSTDDIEIGPIISAEINLGEDDLLCNSEILLLEISSFWIDPVWQDGFTGNQYTVYEGGTYSVQTTLPCPVSDVIFIDDCDDTLLDVDEEFNTTQIIVYPIPSTGFLNLTGISKYQYISIHNMLGQLVFERSIMGETSLMLDLNFLSSGNYNISISSPNDVISQKFVIMK